MESEKSLIIMVDDNPANLRIGKNLLLEKHTVATAPSAEKLFSLLENNHPVLILLDVDMPEMNGYEAIKMLKSKPETANIPVIFLTARTDPDAEVTGLSLGAVDYITKPIQPQLLLKRIELHLLIGVQSKIIKQQTEMQNTLLKKTKELVKCAEEKGIQIDPALVELFQKASDQCKEIK